jgi:acetyltransferase-like isoleucine patch superfamily enzyme
MWRGKENVTIGEYSYGDPHPTGNLSKLTIGKFCSIGSNVIFDLGMQHNTSFVSQYPFNHLIPECKDLPGHPMCKGDIVVGNDVWIGTDAVIMGGVTIGDGAIIGMRSIISKNVEPYTVVVGAPQRVLRLRYRHSYIQALLDIAWWNKPIEEIVEIAPLLMNNDIEKLLNHYKK